MDILINLFCFWLLACLPIAAVIKDWADIEGLEWLLLLLIVTPGYLLSVYFFWQFPHFQNPTFMQYFDFVDQSSPWYYWGLPFPFAFVGFIATLFMIDPN